MRRARRDSRGSQEVCSEAREEVGVCRARILERVERNFRRMRCGRSVGMCREGSEKEGILGTANERVVVGEPSPPRRKYRVAMKF